MALRVGRVHGVVDVAAARAHLLPSGVSPRLSRVARGALGLDGRLYLDLDLLALDGELPAAEPPAGPHGRGGRFEGPTLVFRVGGQAWAMALSAVTQVVQPADLCPTPGRSAALVEHAGAVWPVYALGERRGGLCTVVLAEHGGRPFGLLADEVLGIFEQLAPGAEPGTWSGPGGGWTAAALDPALLFA
jgi:chemotaxis signal transduction protein